MCCLVRQSSLRRIRSHRDAAQVEWREIAKDAPQWRDSGYHNYRASRVLFECGDPFLWFPAASLGHHALEMLLKAALIHEGMTMCDPRKVKDLDPALGLTKDDCIWGHALVEPAK
jgi:hypothetical protein